MSGFFGRLFQRQRGRQGQHGARRAIPAGGTAHEIVTARIADIFKRIRDDVADVNEVWGKHALHLSIL